jgi:hypothetical protein
MRQLIYWEILKSKSGLQLITQSLVSFGGFFVGGGSVSLPDQAAEISLWSKVRESVLCANSYFREQSQFLSGIGSIRY